MLSNSNWKYSKKFPGSRTFKLKLSLRFYFKLSIDDMNHDYSSILDIFHDPQTDILIHFGWTGA